MKRFVLFLSLVATLAVAGPSFANEKYNEPSVKADNKEAFSEIATTVRKEMDGGLYKIWPKEKLPPGQYAVIEFTDGKMNMQVWDFAIK